MDEFLQALTALLAALGKAPNRQEALKKFHEQGQAVAQHFIDMGHGIEREASKEAIKAANTERDTAKADLIKANTTIATLKAENPDVAALEAKHAAALQELQNKFDAEKSELKNQIRDGYVQRDVAILKTKLKEKKVNDAIAHVLLQDQDLLDRISHDAKGATTVKQAGTRTPYTVASGQDVFDVVVENELIKRVPSRGFDEEVDSGSESDGHGHHQSTPPAGGKKGKVFERVRKAGEDRNKAATATSLAEKRAQKLRGTTPAR